LVLALAATSHWFLDFLVHRPDLPLWGNSHHVGLALWNQPVTAFLLELGLLLGCAAVLVRSTSLPRASRTPFFWLLGFLVVFHAGSLFAPTPPGPATLVVSALALYLVVVYLARRVDRRLTLGIYP
jgi:predicted membrane channel-forming protein YqfA (hemolysin III family)